MRDEKELAKKIELNTDKLFGNDWITKLAYSAGYMDGVKYADNHPNWKEIVERLRKEITNDLRNDRWVSVEDKLPPLRQRVLAYNGVTIYIAWVSDDFVWRTHKEHCFRTYPVTHWTHLPQPPVLSNFSNTGKDLKGGEEWQESKK